jgi:hypothetical protein
MSKKVHIMYRIANVLQGGCSNPSQIDLEVALGVDGLT